MSRNPEPNEQKIFRNNFSFLMLNIEKKSDILFILFNKRDAGFCMQEQEFACCGLASRKVVNNS